MKKGYKGTIFDIMKYAIHDGPGIRTTVFFKGCPLTCWWCQNPESQQLEPEKIKGLARRRYSHQFFGKDEGVIGEVVTVDQVMAEVLKDSIFYESSGGGLTISGGEPLIQPDFLLALLKASRKKGIHTALDTSGYAPWAIFKKILHYVDLFLYDLKIMDDKLHEEYTGVSNRLVLQNLQRLLQNKAAVVIRMPVITGMTDGINNIRAIGDFLKRHKGVEELHLLPYNSLCRDKYQKINRDYAFANLEPPSELALTKIMREFENFGLNVKIRGLS